MLFLLSDFVESSYVLQQITEPLNKKPCSFERIYFSRGNDKDIYKERKRLGALLAKPILESVDYDFENTVFSFIPNTAEVAFLGLIKELELEANKVKQQKILELGNDLTQEKVSKILAITPRVEKMIDKHIKQRTFITSDNNRNQLVSHVYDITYGIVRNYKDTLVLIDDSIVRGTTLKRSIIQIINRLKPKRIIIVSSAPQIRYPDCYGIDMSKMKDFIAFNAAVQLLEDRGKLNILDEVYESCKAQEHLPEQEITNEVKRIYDEFTHEEISTKISEIVKPMDIGTEITVIYQTVEGLNEACKGYGDWYFTGNYPTTGGNRVANKSFMLYMENSDARAY